jgi:hypothetical protein
MKIMTGDLVPELKSRPLASFLQAPGSVIAAGRGARYATRDSARHRLDAVVCAPVKRVVR